jgi:hypothetical protein
MAAQVIQSRILGVVVFSSARGLNRYLKAMCALPQQHFCRPRSSRKFSMATSLSEELCSTTDAFLEALCANLSSCRLLPFFSTTNPVVIQHAPACSPYPHSSRLTGLNAVRSYFDILATHWVRVHMQIHGPPRVETHSRRVSVGASITWMWRRSGRRWTEDFTCAIDFDDNLKIVSFIVRTDSSPETCIMVAKDEGIDSSVSEGSPAGPANPRMVSITLLFASRALSPSLPTHSSLCVFSFFVAEISSHL